MPNGSMYVERQAVQNTPTGDVATWTGQGLGNKTSE